MTAATIDLDDKYALERGRVFVTGTQLLVRLPMEQRRRDLARRLNTACFISGYRGSPLGLYDRSLWQAQKRLHDHHVHFQPGVNEELAATAVWGSQQVNLFPGAKYDGVFGIWYGKGPGVDRSLDAFRHANFAGTSRHGGVLALAGDDHGAVSSTTAHQSELNFQSVGIPLLYPASLQEYLDFGLLGFAMSRFAGVWVGFKCITEIVESSASITIDPATPAIVTPEGVPFPPDGLHIRTPDTPLAQERRLLEFKLPAALAFARENGIDRVAVDASRCRLGIVTAGKSYLDVLQALDDLGISEAAARDIGLSIYKIGLVWPLEPDGLRAFASGHEELLVVEEKRAVIEGQVRELLYGLSDKSRPRITGKADLDGMPLLPSDGVLTPAEIARAIARRLEGFHSTTDMQERLAFLAAQQATLSNHTIGERRPYFCSGCPHNTSTQVPNGSRALAGIGCHFMAQWMNRSTATFTQMGAEGTPWIGQAPFTEEAHVFANIGDGTYYHSGLLAIRASVAANVNITYKLLYDDAVAMTGGQPVDGQLSVRDITLELIGEGVKQIVVVSDEPEKYRDVSLPASIAVRHRDSLAAVQNELRRIPGCTVLIYDQTCAAEKRRRRKRRTSAEPNRRIFINEMVCEGCGDCSVKSNCVSIEPVETEFGRKRKVNQSACNKDFSCANGFCPSFVVVEGATIRRAGLPKSKEGIGSDDASKLPIPNRPPLDQPYNILVAGIGGTGVVTVGAVLGMAAHIEGCGVTVLDQTGLAQKNGAVTSHVRIGASSQDLHAVRITAGGADLVLGCDMVVAGSRAVLETMQSGATRALVNSHLTPTADFVLDTNTELSGEPLIAAIERACTPKRVESLDADRLATLLLGDAIAANVFMLGHAFQRGLIPLSLASLTRAIEVNGVAVEANKRAFALGRLHAHHPQALVAMTGSIAARTPKDDRETDNLERLLASRVPYLTAWQDAKWASRYRRLVERAAAAEARLTAVCTGFAAAVARNAAKLMTYKDEYEVARLHTDREFLNKLSTQFDGDYKVSFMLAPPLLARRDRGSGEPRKITFGPWIIPAFRLLAKMRRLWGTWLDIFGYSAERRAERCLVDDYCALVEEICSALNVSNHALAVQLANLPDAVRGFGHVKARNLEVAKTKQAQLLTAFRATVTAAPTAQQRAVPMVA